MLHFVTRFVSTFYLINFYVLLYMENFSTCFWILYPVKHEFNILEHF